MKSFNINSTVKVRLTKVGEELLEKNWKDLWNSIGRANFYKPPTPDADGYVEFQMWDLMKRLGEYCSWGGDLPFDTVILIEDNDLKGEVETDKHKLLKECRQTGRTTATTEKVLKTVFSQMTEIEKTEGEIKVLQAKLELLKEMENHPSPVEEAYKRFFGRYPNSGDCWTDDNEEFWYFFQVGYKSAKEDCKVVEEPKPKKLFDVIRNLGYSVDMCYEIVDAVKECLPDEHCNITDYDLGWNDVLRKIKDGLG